MNEVTEDGRWVTDHGILVGWIRDRVGKAPKFWPLPRWHKPRENQMDPEWRPVYEKVEP